MKLIFGLSKTQYPVLPIRFSIYNKPANQVPAVYCSETARKRNH